MEKFVGLLKVESFAGFVHAPDGDKPYVEVKFWTFTNAADSREWPRVRMSQAQAASLIEHLQKAIAAPALSKSSKPAGSGH